jgi:hypothetical protein
MEFLGSIPDGKDDEIPWIETKNLSKDWIDKFHKPKKENSPKQQDDKLAQKRCTYIYKLADLERLETEIVQLWGVAFAFTSYLNYPDFTLAVEALDKQCAASPLMAQALERTRKTLGYWSRSMQTFDRILELREASIALNSPSAYFRADDDKFTLRVECFAERDRNLARLPEDAWKQIKIELMNLISVRDPKRGWQSLFDTFNEVRAYLSARPVLSCIARLSLS